MKKLISIVLVAVLLMSMSGAAFAADQNYTLPSSHIRDVEDVDIPENSYITNITTNAAEDVKVNIEFLDNSDSHVQANIKKANDEAKKADTNSPEILDSFEIEIISRDGEPVPDGEVIVNLQMTFPESYIGSYITFIRTVETPDGLMTVVEQTILITDLQMLFTLLRAGVYTAVITRARLAIGVSPQTGDNYFTVIFASAALLAIGGAVYARKRRAN